MGKTFYDVWLSPPLPSCTSSSTQFLKHNLPLRYYQDDAETRRLAEQIGVWVDIESIDSSFSIYTRSVSHILKEKKIHKRAVLCIIADCINHLSILIGLHLGARSSHSKTYYYQSVECKYEDHTDYNFHVIGGAYTDSHKVQKDFKEIVSVLTSLWSEVNIFSNMTSLIEFISASKAMREDEDELMEECEKKNAQFLNMLKELKFTKDNTMKKLKLEDTKADELRVYMKDLYEYTSAELDYVTKWEEARNEQNCAVIRAQENTYGSVIEDTKKKLSLEDICHKNIQEFYTESTNDKLDEIQEWMKQHEAVLEEKDMQILHTKHVTDVLTEKRAALQEKYDKRAEEMEAWLERKRIKREIAERIEWKRFAATKIQAWWRGVMVRKKLGPYRRKTKGKKGDKKGDKKGKKNPKRKIKK